jgi:NADPH2:quinone reductase
MRVIEVQGYGDASVLREAERPDPVPAPGSVLVRVRAAAVNPVDLATRAGVFAEVIPDLAAPFVLGWDFAGEVAEPVDGFVVGERVAGFVPWFPVGGAVGAYAEYLVADGAWLARVPDGISDVVAATIPLNGLLAAQSLATLGVWPGQTILVTGASGAVGGYAVQLAAADGVHVIAMGSVGDEDHVAGLGAKHVAGRAGPAELVAAVRAIQPHGVDAVLDAGTAGPELIAAVADGGRFVAVREPAAPARERGIAVYPIRTAPDPVGLRDLFAAVARGELTSRIEGTMPLALAAEAHLRAETERPHGKIVLTV